MYHRWLPPALLGLAAIGALVIGIWALLQGANLLMLVPAVGLVVSLVMWATPAGTWAAAIAAACTLVVAFIFGSQFGQYLIPSALLASMAAVLKTTLRHWPGEDI